jgi:heme-degrading monooxygenase HmoA
MTETIGSATFTGLGGCARRQVVVTTTWESLDTGAHTFWVKVDSAEAVTETWETDNTASGVALVNPHQRFLPLVLSEE